MMKNSIENIIKENKIMVIDGSMSTPLENRGVSNMFRFELSTRKLCWHSNICDPREGDS